MKKIKVIIFAGVRSPQWDTEANALAKVLEKEGYIVVDIIPISGLERPFIEYLK